MQMTGDIKPGEIIGKLRKPRLTISTGVPNAARPVDEPDLGQVLHHEKLGHEPVPVS